MLDRLSIFQVAFPYIILIAATVFLELWRNVYLEIDFQLRLCLGANLEMGVNKRQVLIGIFQFFIIQTLMKKGGKP